MNKTRQIIDEHKKKFPEFQYYHSIIDKIEENIEKMPDVTIESCKSLFEGISKTILKNFNVVYAKQGQCIYSPSQLLKKTLAELSRYSNIDEDFVKMVCNFVNKISEIRNNQGDISHGRQSPKETNSHEDLADMLVNISDEIIFYLLKIYFNVDLSYLEDIGYEDNEEFNQYLDDSNESKGIVYSQALFNQDLVSYKEQLNNYLLDKRIEILERFNEQANKLADKKFDVLHKQNVKMSFVSDGKVFGNVKSEFPDTDLLKIFLMEFRFFYIRKQNPYNFEKICEFFIENNFEREKAKEWLDAYGYIFSDESLKLRIGDKLLTTKMIFETILNAEYFHQEGSQKGIKLIKLSPFIEPMARMKFFDIISKLRIIICAVNKQVVEKYLKTR